MPDFKEITFQEFYGLYPRKVGRFLAEKSFKKLNKRNRQLAYEGLIKYIKFWESNKTEKQFIPHPSTWLNQKRWDDELESLDEVVEEKFVNKTLEQVKNSEGASEEEIKDALSPFLNKKRIWKET